MKHCQVIICTLWCFLTHHAVKSAVEYDPITGRFRDRIQESHGHIKGGSPYPFLDNSELIRLLKSGYRMEKPDLCSDECYAVMTDCWKKDPVERPSFSQLFDTVERLILEEIDYFDFDKLDESKDYYAVQQSKSEETGCSENTFL